MAGLPNVRIHDLCHNAATFMINAGVDLFTVGRILGHTDHKSTMSWTAKISITELIFVAPFFGLNGWGWGILPNYLFQGRPLARLPN